jgi:hypothetical protein
MYYMKKRESRKFLLLFAFGLLGVFIFSTVVSAQVASTIFDPVKNMFSDWGQGNLSINIAKYLFLALLTLVIFGLVGFVPGLSKLNVALKLISALIIAFLATAYLTPSNVYTVLASYGALGIVLGAVIPFVILLFFSSQLGKEGGAGGMLLSKIIWAAFILFLVWKIVDGMFNISGVGATIGAVEGWVYVAFIVLSLAWVFGFDRYIFAFIKKEGIKDVKSRYAEAAELSGAKTKTDSEFMKKYAK